MKKTEDKKNKSGPFNFLLNTSEKHLMYAKDFRNLNLLKGKFLNKNVGIFKENGIYKLTKGMVLLNGHLIKIEEEYELYKIKEKKVVNNYFIIDYTARKVDIVEKCTSKKGEIECYEIFNHKDKQLILPNSNDVKHYKMAHTSNEKSNSFYEVYLNNFSQQSITTKTILNTTLTLEIKETGIFKKQFLRIINPKTTTTIEITLPNLKLGINKFYFFFDKDKNLKTTARRI